MNQYSWVQLETHRWAYVKSYTHAVSPPVVSKGPGIKWAIFFSHFLFKVSKITWELCHNPWSFLSCVFVPQDVCQEVCVSAGVRAQRSQEEQRQTPVLEAMAWAQLPHRQVVWCCGHIQKALFSHRLTTESVYFECCPKGVLHLSTSMLTSLCRTCSSAKTYHGILTCTKSD